MGNGYGYGTDAELDPKYTVYQIKPLKSRYGLPALYKGKVSPRYKNKMVGYVLNTVSKREAASNTTDSIDGIFADRLGLIKSSIELTLLQLNQRREIHHDLVYHIDLDSVRADSLIYAMGPRAYDVGRERLAIEKVKFDLESQRRMENVSYFKDSAFLNKDLKESLIEYLGEVNKSSLLTETEVGL
jgi:hypothetical protein